MTKQKGKPPKPARRYVRTIKRYSLRINLVKWLELLQLLEDYARQKDYFLCQYGKSKNIYACYSFRDLRNKKVARRYKSPFGLQARQWKLALKDSLETIDRYWASLAARWREHIYASRRLSKEEKQYLLWVISSRKRIYEFLKYGASVECCKLDLSLEQRKHCRRFFKRLLKKMVKRAPRVKIRRSFLAEPETYRIFEHKGRQYIAIMSEKPGERLVIPLSGKATISGQIRIVFDYENQRIEIHHLVKSRVKLQKPKGKKLGIDLGITEVFTDSDGDRWGTRFGKTTGKTSDEQKEKGKKRNKLHAVAQKHRAGGKKHKARNLRRYNLGKKKLKRRHRRGKEELTRQVNEALNRFINDKQPKKVLYEDLRHMRGKAKSKKMSRLVSAWIRNIIRRRLEFKIVSQGGSLLELVNCAHSSRVCPICAWVAKSNRKGDRFKCQFCGHTAQSDWTAAMEILRRENDPEIRLWTHRTQVEKILLMRFRRRLENRDFSIDLSQVNWEPIRRVFGDVEDILAKLGVDRLGNPGYRSGQDSRTSCTTHGNQGGRANHPPGGSQSESETLTSKN
jgi:transposase